MQLCIHISGPVQILKPCLRAAQVKEIIYPLGATIDVRAITLGDDTMSVLEIWGAEYQARRMSSRLSHNPTRMPACMRRQQRHHWPPVQLSRIEQPCVPAVQPKGSGWER